MIQKYKKYKNTQESPGISVGDKAGFYSLSDWVECPAGSAVCGIRFHLIVNVIFIIVIIIINLIFIISIIIIGGMLCMLLILLSYLHFTILICSFVSVRPQVSQFTTFIIRTRVQEGETDDVSNLGQTEVILHCCQIP